MIRHRQMRTWNRTIDVLELTDRFAEHEDGEYSGEFEELVSDLISNGSTDIRLECGQLEDLGDCGPDALFEARDIAIRHRIRFAYDYQGNAEARQLISRACYGDVGDIGFDDDDGAGCLSPLAPPPGFGTPSMARPLEPDIGDDAG